ncbi:DUF4352 domain-containing protein [Nocardia sp. CA2R105]|uniref:DUF4352 domain-containing protein n=1 Tax=Nocardia coffeae TaxID=2873381 RepID=UPI001CA71F42|nr:DUF4352 domain-containing protein [Nocardia coffeae]MBY8859504.1 DUF4352 domain-containing protein [Nocardia coffeae]
MSNVPPPHGVQSPGPYRQPPYGGYRQQPPRKRRTWPWVLGGFVVVFVVIVGGCGALLTTATNKVAQEARNGTPTSAMDNAAPAGTQVRDGKFGFTVTRVDPPTKTVGTDEITKRDAQGEYILVHVDITNTAAAPQIYFADNQKLIDSQGKIYSDDSTAEVNLNPNLATTVNPGNHISVILAYDVPAGTTPAVMDFHDSAFSGGTKVALN